jgi:shikimate kinase
LAERVILTGFMGSGKTAVGRRLSEKLGTEFRDTDFLVERRMGMSISDAFTNQGEGFFRSQEEAVILDELGGAPAGERGLVVSLGGGSITIETVRQLLEQEACVFLLDVGAEKAYERARGGKRPLASSRQKFMQLYAERSELYQRVADEVIDVGDKSIEDLADQIIGVLERRTGNDPATG